MVKPRHEARRYLSVLERPLVEICYHLYLEWTQQPHTAAADKITYLMNNYWVLFKEMGLFTKKYEGSSPRGTCRASDRDSSISSSAERVGSLARVSRDGGPAGAETRGRRMFQNLF